jgi:hypothetical protein
MSYIADQLKRIGLVINYVTKTPENEYPYKVSVRFSHINGSTNEIGITNNQLTKIYRILSNDEKDTSAYKPFRGPRRIDPNRRRGLRKNSIPTDYEYRMREAQLFRKDIQDVEKASLADRKEAAMHWLFDLKNNPLMVAERVLWLFQGAYGKGSYDAACSVLKSRMNQVAWAAITIAALEWKCPARFATMAWKKLNPVEQRKVNGLIKMKIEEFKKDGSCG